MFRIGGQAGQGTGIMSHVEPKNYVAGGRVMAAGGYDPRGSYFGYGADPRGTYFGPSSTAPVSETPGMFDPYASTGATTEAEKISSFENSYEKARQKRLEQLEKIRKYGPKAVAAAEAAAGTAAGYTGILGPAVAGLGLGYGKRRFRKMDSRNT